MKWVQVSPKGRFVTDVEMMQIREAAINEVKKYAENEVERLNEKVRALTRQIYLAESFIPVQSMDAYYMHLKPYGGSDPD